MYYQITHGHSDISSVFLFAVSGETYRTRSINAGGATSPPPEEGDPHRRPHMRVEVIALISTSTLLVIIVLGICVTFTCGKYLPCGQARNNRTVSVRT